MSKINNCPLCNGTNLEKMEEGFLCSNCGLGFPQITQFDKTNFFRIQFDTVLLFKMMNPKKDQSELTEAVMNFLHKQEKHPVRPDGYCEFCEKVIK